MDTVQQRDDYVRLGQADAQDRGAEFKGDGGFLLRVVPDHQLDTKPSSSVHRFAASQTKHVEEGGRKEGDSVAHLVLRELRLSSSAGDREVFRLAEHGHQTNSGVEICRDVQISV